MGLNTIFQEHTTLKNIKAVHKELTNKKNININ